MCTTLSNISESALENYFKVDQMSKIYFHFSNSQSKHLVFLKVFVEWTV